MNKILVKTAAISILMLLILPLSQVVTKKRVIVIENPSADKSSNESFTFQAAIPEPPEESPPFSAKEQRVNALFLGIAGQGNNAPNLTDTLMVMSINPKNQEGFLLSIPRDLLIKAPNGNYYTKINSLYQEKGIEAVKNILSEITGLKFDYNIVIDLQGVKKIIDQLDGIDILVEKDIYDPAFPGPADSYQLFTLKKGWQHLDGETALKYIRTRHDPSGDFARMDRQQKILIALKEKIASLHPIWNLAIIFDIWKTAKDHFQTNLSLLNIKSFWKTAKNFSLEKINFRVLDAETGLLVPGHTLLGNERAYILKPKAGINNYEEIKSFVKTLFK